MVDAVIRCWLTLVVPYEDAENGLGRKNVGKTLTLIYADDGLLSAKDREWLQKALNELVEPV